MGRRYEGPPLIIDFREVEDLEPSPETSEEAIYGNRDRSKSRKLLPYYILDLQGGCPENNVIHASGVVEAWTTFMDLGFSPDTHILCVRVAIPPTVIIRTRRK